MFTAKYIFVEHSHGDYEGNKYNNIVLSDGVRTAKFRNETGSDVIKFNRGDDVTVEFDVEFAKGDAVKLIAKNIEEAID